MGTDGMGIPGRHSRTRPTSGKPKCPSFRMSFRNRAAAFLGVDMPTVGVGEAVYPVLTATLER